MMSVAAHHNDWLSLIEVSGPFLALPVLMDALPAGLDKPPGELTADLWRAFSEWSDEDHGGAADTAVHEAWIRYVVEHVLEYEVDVLVRDKEALGAWTVEIPEHDATLMPDLAIRDPEDDEGTARLLVTVAAPDVSVTEPSETGWAASPAERMEALLKGVEARLGVVTNGDQWTLVHVAEGENTGFATWYASLWREEQLTLRAFITLLGMRRLFAVADDETLEALLDRSREDHQGVTTQLGKQVRRAIEILIQQIDRVDHDRDGRLLEGMTEARLYEAAVTVMMRLIFLFYAEENDLLLLGDDFYDDNYAASTLREQLQATADENGEEILERLHDAWPRLLSTFRAVHTGVEHEQMRLPAYGGALFDPDRYPFLEGREPDTRWADDSADPLPIDNRTVLHLLNAIQTLEVKVPGGGRENRPLSFRALDVEQIGHVYETLLDHTAVRADDWVFGLEGTKDKEPEVALAELEARAADEKDLVKYLKDETGRSAGALNKRVAAEQKAVYDRWGQRWTPAFHGDESVARRASPWGLLVREDSAEHPVVVPPGRVYVTESERRRSSGTHYTPRSLTEEIVTHALEPLVYDGPADGNDRSDWDLRTPDEILDLKVCDPACGSGAFLVQACRYLAERLVEAWQEHGASNGPDGHALPSDPEERLVVARRYVADRCMYGVDINPLATEMAKLSLWLVTLQKNRPFTFLDHAVRTGDSLLGVTDFETLETFGVSKGQTQLWSQSWAPQLKAAREAREELRSFSVIDPGDAAQKRDLLDRAADELSDLQLVADAVAALQLASAARSAAEIQTDRHTIGTLLERAFAQQHVASRTEATEKIRDLVDLDAPEGDVSRRPFHWILEFPEVMDGIRGGFDGFIGNPPFLGGTRISTSMGSAYRHYLSNHLVGTSTGRADYVTFFMHRAVRLLGRRGTCGFVTTNSIAQGDSLEHGLGTLVAYGLRLYRAVSNEDWPGDASVSIAKIWGTNQEWGGVFSLDREHVRGIEPSLKVVSRVSGDPGRLPVKRGLALQGVKTTGMGFVLDEQEARNMLEENLRLADVVRRYQGGDDLNRTPDQRPARWVIDFADWPLERAAQYPEALKIVEDRVRPERLNSSRPRLVEHWWQFEHPAMELRHATADQDDLLVMAQISKTLAPVYVPNDRLVNTKVMVFIDNSIESFGLLASELHASWVMRYAAMMRSDFPMYSGADVYETFPLHADDCAGLADAAKEFATARQQLMDSMGTGLTGAVKALHTPDDERAAALRYRYSEMNDAILSLLGWGDLVAGWGFRSSALGVRWTFSVRTEAELLDRMLELNFDRSGGT